MSSCLSGGGRAYRLDLELIKSPSTSWTSHSSSPSSTLSESTNSPVTIITRKPRTPRKRPNQIYNEAASILSTAYPKIFTKPRKFNKPCKTFAYEIPDLFLPFQVNGIDNSGFLLYPPSIEKQYISRNSFERPCLSPGEITSSENFLDFYDEPGEDFDAESILDEEIEEGINSIMGDIMEKTNNESVEESKNGDFYTTQMMDMSSTCYGYPVAMGYYGNFIDDCSYGLRREAFRNGGDELDWRRFSSVDVNDITPGFNKIASDKKKKRTLVGLKNLGKGNSSDLCEGSVSHVGRLRPSELVNKVPSYSSLRAAKGKDNLVKKVLNEEEDEKEEVIAHKPNAGLQLKLDYDDILEAWSDRSTPFPDELLSSEGSANDVQTRLSKIDLFTEDGKLREASVIRYKEKRRTRLFSKKIRYEVRKLNADQRPRMKGRFVRRPESPNNDQQ